MPKTDLLQGTLDLLILKILTLGPNHGWGIANRIRQISRDSLQASQGSLYPALHRREVPDPAQQGWLAFRPAAVAWPARNDHARQGCTRSAWQQSAIS